MSRFEQVKHPDDPELKSVYGEIVEAGWQGSEEGVPVNAVTALCERPDILTGLWAFVKRALGPGSLPPTVKEMIAMSIAMQNDCRYCTVAHTNALKAMGVPSAVIETCASDPAMVDLPPPQRAMILFALKTARNPKTLSDEDFQGLRDQGLSDGEIIEVIMLAACGNLLDTWADASGISVDGQDA